MYKRKLLFFSIILLLPASFLGAETYKYSGTAFDLKTKEALYTDNHTENIENGKHISSVIEYRDPAGKIFANKKIQFSKNANLPDFKLEDYRDGYMEGCEVNGNKVKLIHRKSTKDVIEEKVFDMPENPVVDGGFDYFIKDNWDKLLEGNKLTFHMFSPSKLNYFKFKIVKNKTAKFKGRDAVYLKMDLNAFLVNVLFPTIWIVYDIETKRIVHYEGISNINNNEGKSYFVRILYNHSAIK